MKYIIKNIKYENMKSKVIKTNLSLKGYLKYFILNRSELVYQLRESFDAWNINPVNRVVFTSSTETDEYRDLYLNW